MLLTDKYVALHVGEEGKGGDPLKNFYYPILKKCWPRFMTSSLQKSRYGCLYRWARFKIVGESWKKSSPPKIFLLRILYLYVFLSAY